MADVKSLDVSSIKKLEAELAQRREAAKTSIVAQAGELISQLSELGFSYTFAETVKLGRPKKGGANAEA